MLRVRRVGVSDLSRDPRHDRNAEAHCSSLARRNIPSQKHARGNKKALMGCGRQPQKLYQRCWDGTDGLGQIGGAGALGQPQPPPPPSATWATHHGASPMRPYCPPPPPSTAFPPPSCASIDSPKVRAVPRSSRCPRSRSACRGVVLPQRCRLPPDLEHAGADAAEGACADSVGGHLGSQCARLTWHRAPPPVAST